jgi:hypothetical protein
MEWIMFKKINLKILKNHDGNIRIQKLKLVFGMMFLYLQCFNHKKFIENNDVSKVLNFMFKTLKINI